MSAPTCNRCGRSHNTQFPMMPKTKGYSFGEICVDCDNKPPLPQTVAEAYELAQTTRGHNDPHEISEEAFEDALCCMPPIYGDGCFWVGEPLSHDDQGREISLECWEWDSRFYCRISTVKQRKTPA